MEFKTLVILVIGSAGCLLFLAWLNGFVGGGNIFRFIAQPLAVVGILAIVLGLAGSGFFYQEARSHR